MLGWTTARVSNLHLFLSPPPLWGLFVSVRRWAPVIRVSCRADPCLVLVVPVGGPDWLQWLLPGFGYLQTPTQISVGVSSVCDRVLSRVRPCCGFECVSRALEFLYFFFDCGKCSVA